MFEKRFRKMVIVWSEVKFSRMKFNWDWRFLVNMVDKVDTRWRVLACWFVFRFYLFLFVFLSFY